MKLLSSLLASIAAVSAATVDTKLATSLANGEKADVIVEFGWVRHPQPEKLAYLNRPQRRFAVYEHLTKVAHESQQGVKDFLAGQGKGYISQWMDNSLLIPGADLSLVNSLSSFNEIKDIHGNDIVATLDVFTVDSVEVHNEHPSTDRFQEYGLEIINVNGAWNVTQGEGVVISNIDTGVRYTHESLVDSYRGTETGSHDYNWFDPNGQTVPFDNNGHGTHTMGTIAGNDASGRAIGVAPASKWIAAKGCASSSCSQSDLTRSFEYVLCPTRQGGSDPDCSQGADIVSNSWGGGRGSSTYVPWIQNCLDAGMAVLFSQGNSGSSCSTANSPGDLDIVIGVGSTDSSDRLSSFSSRGPGVGSSSHPLQKPDISAPGSAVRSAYHLSDNSYASLSGTSMACPHAAGLGGLIWSANPSLNFDDMRELMDSTADTTMPNPGSGQTSCSGVSYNEVPNYHYGYGRIDAAASVNAALKRN